MDTCVLFLLLLLSTRPVSATLSCNFPAVFNFGDSNSDTGGLAAAFGQFSSPNGETFFHRPAGRVSDGRLLIDFIGMQSYYLRQVKVPNSKTTCCELTPLYM